MAPARDAQWAAQNLALLAGMAGQTLTGARMIEMALFEQGPDGVPRWTHPELPFRQAHLLDLVFGDSTVIRLRTHQNDDSWGLWPRQEPVALSGLPDPFKGHGAAAIFRFVASVPLPFGRVTSVRHKLDDKQDITEVHITTDTGAFALKAGEVIEDHGGRYRVCQQDESVLIFHDPSHIARGPFT